MISGFDKEMKDTKTGTWTAFVRWDEDASAATITSIFHSLSADVYFLSAPEVLLVFSKRGE